jgi:Fic-DOC domain mobile mystery protein B
MNDLMHQKAGNTPIDPDELAGLRHKHVTTHEELNQLEHANIQQGLEWLSRQRSPQVLTEQYVRELHRQLFGAVWLWAGEFRQTEKNIGIDPIMISIELRQLMDNTAYWVEHHTYPALETTARYHHRMLQIHPFPNGNGRFARIITNELQRLIGTPLTNWAANVSEADMPAHRKAYIDALRAADALKYDALFTFMQSVTKQS